MNTNRIILPKNIKPSHYTLCITPNLESFVFEGKVTIEVSILEDSNTITLNVLDLNIASASLLYNNMVLAPKEIVLDNANQTLSLVFNSMLLQNSTASLNIQFTGSHNDQLVGFYRSSYLDKNNKKQYLVVTQFCPTDCRRCFPCWDEPNLKATFDITLIVPKHLTALANMNVLSEEVLDEGLKSVTFSRTPIMSPYLVTMCVGDFDYVERVSHPTFPANSASIVCRTYTLKGQSDLGKFSVEVAVKVLEYFSKYFDIAYPLPKLDMIAIPDFAFGAMENWGLVTYRETAILYDPIKSSSSGKKRVAYTVGHELAHQWFGNLVTMDWWNDLWLNEGFATSVGWMVTDYLFPDWNVMTEFLVNDYTRGINLDSLRSSHPIEVEVNSPSEIGQIFDAISYSKGASIILMLSNYLGQEKFSLGVNRYLKKYAYSNATTKNLWDALSEASGQDVEKIMNAWTGKTGCPVLTIIDESYDEKQQEITLKLKQTRFLASGDLNSDEDLATWFIPISVITDNQNESHIVRFINTKNGTITFPYKYSSNSFWKLNASVTGFYRVCYNHEQLGRLANYLRTNPQSPILTNQDRIGIISDSFAVSRAGLGKVSSSLNVLKSLQSDSNVNVLTEIFDKLQLVQSVWRSETIVYNHMLDLQKKIFSPIVAQLGFDYADGEDYSLIVKRNLAVQAAADAGSPNVLEQLQKLFDAFVNETQSIHPNLRNLVFKTVLVYSKNPQKDFDLLLDISKTASTVDERMGALLSLGCVNDDTILKSFLNDMVLNPEIVRQQDLPSVLDTIGSKSPLLAASEYLWDWFKRNWKLLQSSISNLGLLGKILVACMSSKQLQDIVDWSSGSDCPNDSEKIDRVRELLPIRRSFDQTIEKLKINRVWGERDLSDIREWVQNDAKN
ncbi:peptidase family M1-domain-containing protein [Globomyces pollinis-pini]|nr:peptidase family M1-domain-containing protein [Globomyces pollinis-pini]